MKLVSDYDLSSKVVVLRCDLNVKIKNGKVVSMEKVIASLKTINFILDSGAKLVILSHLGKVKNEDDKISNSLSIVGKELELLTNNRITFFPYTRGEKVTSKIKSISYGHGILLENTRFLDLEGNLESSCDVLLSKEFANFGDIFINDAFGMIHRMHASNYGIASYIPSGIGFLVQNELENLNILNNPKRPFGIIMGGAKISDKLKVIEILIKKCDHLYIGGAMAFTFLKALGYNIGNSIYEEELLDYCLNLYEKYKSKIVLPLDFKGETKTYSIGEIPNDFVGYDIGDRTIELFKKSIVTNKTVFWNGPLGKYEEDKYQNGTKEIMSICENLDIGILGGGDTIAACEKFRLLDKFTFISTGGGATLEYISNNDLPCLKVISK